MTDQAAAEVIFQRRTRYAHVIGHLFGLDALTPILPDVMARTHDIGTRYRLMTRRFEHVDTDRRHENASAVKARAAQHLVQQMRSGAAHFFGTLNNRRKRYAGE